MKRALFLGLLLIATILTTRTEAQEPVKVFILAGQSNMQGHGEMDKGKSGDLRHTVEENDNFKHLIDSDGQWSKREDVQIYGFDKFGTVKSGALTAGYGAFEYTIGPELTFGNIIGDYYDNDVLLIKTSWGGKSLAVDFCPPSAVSESGYERMPRMAQDTGYYYVQMLATVHEVVTNLSKYVPNYKGQGYEIAGFAWHQGWNDLVNKDHTASYEKNLAYFIKDIRRDLGEPEMPFILATSGMRSNIKWHESLKNAQKSAALNPEFRGNVKVVETDSFWKEESASPSKQNYHWNRNAESYCLIGESLGNAMIEMLNEHAEREITPKLRAARAASDKILAPLPPMGWNSWNAFEKDIDEDKIMAMADIMVSSGMRDLGYEYLVLDDAWMADERNEKGELVADSLKFPGGMKIVGDYIHSKGLKFGIYECRGHVTCQNLPGSFQHEKIDMNSFASWGVDYIKMDACFAARNGRLSSDDFTVYGEAIKDTGRDIVFSISDFGQGAWAWGGKKYGQLWRTSMDIYANINSVYRCAETSGGSGSSHPGFNGLWQFAGPNHWNDPDMLQVGNLKNIKEDKIHFSLWSILSAPLMAGNDLRKMSDEVKDILLAPELIAVNQDSRAIQGYKIYEKDSVQIYNKPLADGTVAVLLFNRGEKIQDATVKWSDIGLSGDQLVRDLWKREDIGMHNGSFTAKALAQHDHIYIKVGVPTYKPVAMPKPTPFAAYTITKMGTTYLSDLYYIMKEYNHPKEDKNFFGDKIVVDGVKYKKGLGCKSSSTVMYKIEGKADRFKAVVAIDETSSDEATGKFRVLNEDKFGGRVLFDSGKIGKKDGAVTIDVDVSDVEFLMLEFTGKDVYGNWANARVETK